MMDKLFLCLFFLLFLRKKPRTQGSNSLGGGEEPEPGVPAQSSPNPGFEHLWGRISNSRFFLGSTGSNPGNNPAFRRYLFSPSLLPGPPRSSNPGFRNIPKTMLGPSAQFHFLQFQSPLHFCPSTKFLEKTTFFLDAWLLTFTCWEGSSDH